MTIATFIIAVATCLVTAACALFAARQISIATKATKIHILKDIRADYKSDNMLSGMLNLKDYYKRLGSEVFANKFAELRKSDYKQVQGLDKDRRRFSHWLFEIYQLYNSGLIDDKFVEILCPIDPANFAITITEPMERAMNPKYNKGMFDMLRNLYGKRLTGELLP